MRETATHTLPFSARILAVFRRQMSAVGRLLAVSNTEDQHSSVTPDLVDTKANGNGGGGGHDGDRERLVKDRLSFVPLYDRGGPVSLRPSADGPITTLARVELNARRKAPLDAGLDDPDQLNKLGSP